MRRPKDEINLTFGVRIIFVVVGLAAIVGGAFLANISKVLCAGLILAGILIGFIGVGTDNEKTGLGLDNRMRHLGNQSTGFRTEADLENPWDTAGKGGK